MDKYKNYLNFVKKERKKKKRINVKEVEENSTIPKLVKIVLT